MTDPLAIRYWSVTPYKLGQSAVKYSAGLVDDGGGFVAVRRSENMLQEALKKRLDQRGEVFEFQVQAQSDVASMPVEDPTIEWDESVSPPITVARIRIPKQEFDTIERGCSQSTSFYAVACAARAPAPGRDQPGPPGGLRIALRVPSRPEPRPSAGAHRATSGRLTFLLVPRSAPANAVKTLNSERPSWHVAIHPARISTTGRTGGMRKAP